MRRLTSSLLLSVLVFGQAALALCGETARQVDDEPSAVQAHEVPRSSGPHRMHASQGAAPGSDIAGGQGGSAPEAGHHGPLPDAGEHGCGSVMACGVLAVVAFAAPPLPSPRLIGHSHAMARPALPGEFFDIDYPPPRSS